MNQYREEFLKKNEKNLCKDFDLQKVKAQVVQNQENDLRDCGELIRQGELVSFPTETVYGLGANALDEQAVLKIYEAKNRPLSDPVIVHITNIQSALDLVDIDSKTKDLFQQLADKFWPGPLTMVLKANEKISPKITANTGFVGIRHPINKTAQQLIDFSQRPIVAPSANMFCHVSPTQSIHVFNDLYDKNLTIIDGNNCEFGMESTVIKIIDNKIQILRNGSISKQQIQEQFNDIEILEIIKFNDYQVNQVAPGQYFKHYAPYLDTYLLKNQNQVQNQKKFELLDACLIDFNQINIKIKHKFKNYLNLTEDKDLKSVMKNFYNILRQAENLQNIKQILITDILNNDLVNQDFYHTIQDKLSRCTQGNSIFVDENQEFYQI